MHSMHRNPGFTETMDLFELPGSHIPAVRRSVLSGQCSGDFCRTTSQGPPGSFSGCVGPCRMFSTVRASPQIDLFTRNVMTTKWDVSESQFHQFLEVRIP